MTAVKCYASARKPDRAEQNQTKLLFAEGNLACVFVKNKLSTEKPLPNFPGASKKPNKKAM